MEVKMKRPIVPPDQAEKLRRRLTRGAMPHNARAAGVPFEKGHPKRAGRKKGVPNRLTRNLKEAIMWAAVASGYDTKGTGGLNGYLKRLADYEVKTFAAMLNSLVPTQIDASIRQEKPYKTEAEVLAELKALGLPRQTIFRLRHHEVPAEDADPYGDDDGKVVDLQPVKPRSEDAE
jgi:hypothetical protein